MLWALIVCGGSHGVHIVAGDHLWVVVGFMVVGSS